MIMQPAGRGGVRCGVVWCGVVRGLWRGDLSPLGCEAAPVFPATPRPMDYDGFAAERG
ncbi:hypothetical protein DFS28_11540 [Pseudomonas sp. 478]|nr:hypothetical protein DFS28_11540 [Pseudomonas sp. 478]TCV47643.1 hypothetical protein EDB99_11540 [Pseudomonas sp. 460]